VHETQNVAWHSGVYYGDLQTATFSAATGCWTRESSANPMTGVTLHYDSTGWTNNSHTFQLTAMDTSGRTGTVSISLQSANAAPVLSFLNHVNGDSVTGQLQVQMTGIPDRQSTAAIVSWCVTRDGVKESKNAASQTGAYYGDLLSPNATFSAATGCWTRASSSTVVESATLAYDTTQWIDGNHTLTVTVKDTSLKSATGTITVHTVNGNTVKATLAVTPKPLVVGTAAAKLTATCGITFGLMKQCAVVVKAGGKTVASGTVKTTSGAASAKLTMTINATGRAMVQAQGGVLPVTLTATVTPMSGALLTATAVDSLLAKTVSITLSSSVLFSSASSVLTPASVKIITALGVKVKGSKMATCAGYTDNQGSASYNLALGLARAKAVCAVLGKYVKKTSAVSFGLTHPVASNATEAGRAKNRRVVLTISN
jgi:outer membrane protein OmpA-like peptidoglycan-associated protein